MSLRSILDHIKQAQQELTELAEGEQQCTGKTTPYAFVYEKYFIDAEEWGLSSQIIYAYDIQGAFNSFGCLVKNYNFIVRNICFGEYEEMQKQIERVDEYWRKHRGNKETTS